MLFQIIYLALAALGLGFLIFIHEMGHFLMAKRVGMKVEAFSIGFGPCMCSWKRNGVDWRIGWIPFGGYVKIAGERKEKDQNPRDIPGGFYSKKPIDRIKVAVIAPIINLIFALLVFTLIWGLGGREKTFQDLTNRIGWIDPQSELYQKGVRPGDQITLYNHRKFHGFKDIFQATMMSGGTVNIQGNHYNFAEGTKEPFNVDVSTYQHSGYEKGIYTSGLLAPANYLLYKKLNNQPNPIMEGSPMSRSGLTYGDRLFWIDGELLFSNTQLSALLNSKHAFLTIQRGSKKLQVKVPRVEIGELKVSQNYREELGDYRFEGELKKPLRNLLTIPYQISSSLEVEIPLRDLDAALGSNSSTNLYPDKLQTGDKILAVDGQRVSRPKELFKRLQTHKFHLIVQQNNQNLPPISWKEANETFDDHIPWTDLNLLKDQIGSVNGVVQKGNLKLLNPVSPMTLLQIAENSGNKTLSNLLTQQREKIEEMTDLEKKEMALEAFNRDENRLYLGVNFQDRKVNYNPTPWVLFGRTTSDIYQTLKSLFSGSLNPKWISGPVGIMQVMQHGWSLGLKEALYWLAMISLNLGILNLLPIPILDGGQICFALYEQFSQKELKPQTMDKIVIPFMILFIGVFVFVTFNDLSRILKVFF